MSNKFERKISEAKDLEDRLNDEGRHLDAQIVKRLRLAAISSNGTLKVIHRDNRELREKLNG